MNTRDRRNFRFLLTLLLVTVFLLTNPGVSASIVYAQDMPSATPTTEPQPTQPTQPAEQPTLAPTQAPAETDTPVAQPTQEPTSEPTVAATPVPPPAVTETPVSPPAAPQAAPVVPIQTESPIRKINNYMSAQTITMADGETLVATIIHGPPVPPPGFEAQRKPAEVVPLSAMILPNVPAFTWVLGCSAVSSAMIAGYYDNGGYPNMYTGPTNSGVMPLTDSSWTRWSDGSSDPSYPNNPLIASHNGWDGRTSKGTLDDYWVQYASSAQDPFITGSWTQHTWGTAIGDYMKTSQSSYGNTDGSTSFYGYPNSSQKLTCSAMHTGGIDIYDGTYGRKLFYEARGYTVTDCYNQSTDNQYSGGFSLANYKAEIDAGHPVLLNLDGHSIVGYGYDSTSNTIYIHDTWDTYQHTMTWGGSYSGMQLLSVSIVNLVSTMTIAPPTLISPSGDITAEQPSYKWHTVSGATGYQLKVTNTDNSTVAINKSVSTTACSGGICTSTPAITLTGINYKFEVAARNSSGQGSYSNPLTFREIRHIPPATPPTLVSPNKPIWVQKPAYKWNPLSVASSYVLRVTNTDSNAIVVNTTVSNTYCTSTLCSYTASYSLPDAHYKFEVAAKNNYGQSAFGGPMTFQEVYHTPPYTPTLISPNVVVYVQKPPYKWTPMAGSTGYVLKVTNTNSGLVVINSVVTTGACSSVTCSYTSSTSLYGGNYKFEVAAKNSYGQSSFSPPMTFLAGFDFTFQGTSTGWKPQAGGGWYTGSASYYTGGSSNKWSTSRYNGSYTDFNYSAQLRRSGGVYYDGTNYWTSANAIFVSQGASFSSANEWYPGYMFAYYDWGTLGYTPSFGIWRNEADGTSTNIVFANTTAVVSNTWNVLRITASGSNLNFYINDILMYSLTDSTFSSGAVGVGMYKTSTASTIYYVDAATLGPYVGGAYSTTISANQQTLNAAGKNIPADYISPEKIKYYHP